MASLGRLVAPTARLEQPAVATTRAARTGPNVGNAYVPAACRAPVRLLAALAILLPVLGASGLDGANTEGTVPADVVLAAAPELVRLAVSESRFDGSADAARALAAKLIVFADGLGTPLDWPSEASIDPALAAAQFRFAQDVTSVLSGVPDITDPVAVSASACTAYFDTAGRNEAVRWAGDVRNATGDADVVLAALDDLLGRAPEGLEVAPLQLARNLLADWRTLDAVAATGCAEDLQREVTGTVGGETLTMRLLRGSAFPTEAVTLAGVALGFPAPLRIEAPTLGLVLQPTVTGGGQYLGTGTVPADAALGSHPFNATYGNLTVKRDLTVLPAPLVLRATYPASVAPNTVFSIEVRTTTPAPLLLSGADHLHLTGDLDAEAVLANGTARFTIRTPLVSTFLQGTIVYEGNAALQASPLVYFVHVAPPAASPPGANVMIWAAITAWTTGHALALTVGLLAFALVALVLRQVARAGPTGPTRGRPEQAAPPERPAWPARGIVAAFIVFVTWLQARGDVRPRDTPRAIAAHLEGRGVRAQPLVRAFERARYGGFAEDRNAAASAPGWLARLAAWLGRRSS